jgi:hypothetical protein
LGNSDSISTLAQASTLIKPFASLLMIVTCCGTLTEGKIGQNEGQTEANHDKKDSFIGLHN